MLTIERIDYETGEVYFTYAPCPRPPPIDRPLSEEEKIQAVAYLALLCGEEPDED